MRSSAAAPADNMKPLPAADLEHVLAHAPWEDLRGARVFITGGTGFFGACLLESFCHANERLSLGATATVLTRDAAGFLARMPHLKSCPGVEYVRGDVRSFADPGGEFSHVIHGATAASAQLNAAAPREMYDTIVQGTRRVLDFAGSCGAQRMLMISSGAVYGVQPPGLSHVPEEFHGAPDSLDVASAYGQGKRTAEFDCALVCHESALEIPIARCFAFVGPHLPLDAHFAAGNFLRDALGGEAIRVGGDGTPLRSYLYAADLAAWLWTLLLRGQSGRAYNVGSDEAVSIAELARRCAALPDPALPVNVDREAVPGALPSRYVPDIGRARRELGLEVRIPLESALGRTYDWLTS